MKRPQQHTPSAFLRCHCSMIESLFEVEFRWIRDYIIVRIFVFNFENYSAQKCHSRISFNHKSCGGVEPVSLLNFISFLRERTNLERQEISVKH